MLYLAALTVGELTKPDFLRYVGHNPVHAGVHFDGVAELASQSVPEGHMKRYVWRMRDKNVTSNDVACVIIFNPTRETHKFEEYRFVYERRQSEIDEFVSQIQGWVNAKSMDTYTTYEGNLVMILRDCKTAALGRIFADHARKAIQSV